MANVTTKAVRAARNPQAAMLAIAEALDRIEAALPQQASADPWGDWRPIATGQPEAVLTANDIAQIDAFREARHTEITGDADHTEVVVPAATPEKMERRRQFERAWLKLSEYLGDDSEDWTEAYAKGGPRWLYYGNRDLVMSYPADVKAWMIEDVLEDSPQEAEEIGRDLLKQSFDTTGPGRTPPHGEGTIG